MRFVQVFYGACPPGSTEPRTTAVVWQDGELIAQDGVEAIQRAYPDAIPLTDVQLWVPIHQLASLNPQYGNPWQNNTPGA